LWRDDNEVPNFHALRYRGAFYLRDGDNTLMANPIPEKIRAQANKVADRIARGLPDDTVFALIIADVGAGGTTSYISNANREDMIKLLKEMVGKMEADG
jgi:hypothetical protein